MNYLVVGFTKTVAKSGTSKDGRAYTMPEGIIFECIRHSKDPNVKGLVTRQIKINADSPFWPVIQNSDLITYNGQTINYETQINGKYETCIDFEFSKEKVPFSVQFISNK